MQSTRIISTQSFINQAFDIRQIFRYPMCTEVIIWFKPGPSSMLSTTCFYRETTSPFKRLDISFKTDELDINPFALRKLMNYESPSCVMSMIVLVMVRGKNLFVCLWRLIAHMDGWRLLFGAHILVKTLIMRSCLYEVVCNLIIIIIVIIIGGDSTTC